MNDLPSFSLPFPTPPSTPPSKDEVYPIPPSAQEPLLATSFHLLLIVQLSYFCNGSFSLACFVIILVLSLLPVHRCPRSSCPEAPTKLCQSNPPPELDSFPLC
jgi:hypothetical protein